MSTVFCTEAVIAGPVDQVERFDRMALEDEAEASSESFTREVLATNEAGHPTCIRYNASMSRYRPSVEGLVGSEDAAALDLLSMVIGFAEQGDGHLGVYLPEGVLLGNNDIYGFSNEGQAELCRAQDLFAETARQRFGVEVVLYDKSKVQRFEDDAEDDAPEQVLSVATPPCFAAAECAFDPMDNTPF